MADAFSALRARDEASVMRTYGRYPLAVSRAQGSRLFDLDGREYVDLLAGIAVCNLGHCHPEVTGAIRRQAGELVHVSNLFYQREQVELAERLLATCHCHKAFFCNSGAEANEGAIKLARRFMREVRGREAFEIITMTGSFHGRTLATLTATGQDKIKQGFAPLPEGFVTVPWGDLTAVKNAIRPETAGVLIEIIQGEGGVNPLPGDYVRGLEALCRERGILFMVDEIQTGMCRTGRFWAFQHHDARPDIFTCAKALANGLPMGALLATDEVAAGFVPGSHATTFGGTPLVSAAASTVVEVMVRERIDDRARRVGDYARGLFTDLRQTYPDKIAGVRGLGLMIGIELAFPGQAVWQELLDRGFVLNLTQDKVLRLLPPLTIPREDLALFASALGAVLGEM
ncbi:MAG: aspartate aminotransferase family protein [Desulfovibrionaceae bacterium]|nr:aspartate aminotransferase family protein [Desulfovibrionaceae bacterium]